ncbi:MFS transporter [Nocardioides sp. BGMRC 2183]|nr:MFS transporter [Nocardioides sp. BGMRC 2183]
MEAFTDQVSTTHAPPAWEQVTAARRWGMLGASTAAQATSAAMVSGPAFLIPELHRSRGMSLAEAGLVASAPLVGLMLTLVAWGVVVDRRGERFALLASLAGTTVAGGLAILAASGAGGTDGSGQVLALSLTLFLAGATSGATSSASGRVVVGWFPPARRGLAMGIRQTAQPLGVGLAAATMAPLAEQAGPAAALWVPTGLGVLAMVLVAAIVLDPPRPVGSAHTAAAQNPYRQDPFLPRVHAASVLLVGPQFLVWTFGLTWLIDDLGWSAAAAGLMVAGTQVGGAAARICAGWYSDHVGTRMRPMRQIAYLAAATLLALGLAAGVGSWATGLGVVLLAVASAVTVADNGLAFTAIAERAGPLWAGRALGLQNTAQHVMAAAIPPVAGLVITYAGYGWAFGLAAVLPLLAVPLVPVGDERGIG